MEVKPGYKQTEVGIIPQEWEVVALATQVKQHNSGIYKNSSQYGKGCNIIGVSEIYGIDSVDGQRFSEVPLTDQELAKYVLKKDDLLYGESSLVREGIARTVYVTERGAGTAFAWHTRRYSVKQSVLSSAYLYYYLQSRLARTHMMNQCIQTALTGINTVAYFACPILVPPLREQLAIAEALSDVDGLLTLLNQLIAKKRDLKLAAMQQLLTGQTRLPGFQGEWKVKRLGDAFTITAGKSKSAFVVEDGDFWVCDMGSVSIEGRLVVSKRTNYRGDFLKRGDLVMPKDDIGGGNIIGKVGYVDANDTYILGDHVYCLRAMEGDPRFLAYVINSHRVNSELRKKVIGSAQLGLGRRSVTEQEIAFPSLSEQTAIAKVITEMDSELTLLEQRREKTRALKQAMMQELLTGKTRLV